MKKLLLLTVLVIGSVFSCKEDDDNVDNTQKETNSKVALTEMNNVRKKIDPQLMIPMGVMLVVGNSLNTEQSIKTTTTNKYITINSNGDYVFTFDFTNDSELKLKYPVFQSGKAIITYFKLPENGILPPVADTNNTKIKIELTDFISTGYSFNGSFQMYNYKKSGVEYSEMNLNLSSKDSNNNTFKIEGTDKSNNDGNIETTTESNMKVTTTDFESTIVVKSNLISKKDCENGDYNIQGSEEISSTIKGLNSKILVNYGTGECDSKANITYEEHTFEIDMKNYKDMFKLN